MDVNPAILPRSIQEAFKTLVGDIPNLHIEKFTEIARGRKEWKKVRLSRNCSIGISEKQAKTCKP